MDTLTAGIMGMMNRGREQMVFDWDKAAKLIKDLGIREAEAGLRGDMGNTGGTILYEGKPVNDSYTYLASTWATPILEVWDPEKGELEYPCYVMAGQTEWDYHTKWPQSAMDILGFTENDFYREEETEVSE